MPVIYFLGDLRDVIKSMSAQFLLGGEESALRAIVILLASALVVGIDLGFDPVDIRNPTRAVHRRFQRFVGEVLEHFVVDVHIIHIHGQRVLLRAVDGQEVPARRPVRDHIARTEGLGQLQRQRIIHKHLRNIPAHLQADIDPLIRDQRFRTGRFGGVSVHGHRQRRLAGWIDRQHEPVILVVAGVEQDARFPFEPHGHVHRRLTEVQHGRCQFGVLRVPVEREPFPVGVFFHEERRLTEQLAVVEHLQDPVILPYLIVADIHILHKHRLVAKHIVVGLEKIRDALVLGPEFRAGANRPAAGPLDVDRIERTTGQLVGIVLQPRLAVENIHPHAGETADVHGPGDDRLAEHLGVVLDRHLRAGHDGKILNAGMVEHLRPVQHHRLGTHIRRFVDVRVAADPSAAVLVTRAEAVLQ